MILVKSFFPQPCVFSNWYLYWQHEDVEVQGLVKYLSVAAATLLYLFSQLLLVLRPLLFGVYHLCIQWAILRQQIFIECVPGTGNRDSVMNKVENNYTSFYLPSREQYGQGAEHLEESKVASLRMGLWLKAWRKYCSLGRNLVDRQSLKRQ